MEQVPLESVYTEMPLHVLCLAFTISYKIHILSERYWSVTSALNG